MQVHAAALTRRRRAKETNHGKPGLAPRRGGGGGAGGDAFGYEDAALITGDAPLLSPDAAPALLRLAKADAALADVASARATAAAVVAAAAGAARGR